jgi:A/G-specific adenine glycosylase
MKFSNTLIHWYLQNKRSAWWKTTNPYASEIMLQQTRVAQGTPYFSLSAAFPLFLIWLKPMKKRC